MNLPGCFSVFVSAVLTGLVVSVSKQKTNPLQYDETAGNSQSLRLFHPSKAINGIDRLFRYLKMEDCQRAPILLYLPTGQQAF
jgi:hypothetical protein